jgi:hypothetical protein
MSWKYPAATRVMNRLADIVFTFIFNSLANIYWIRGAYNTRLVARAVWGLHPRKLGLTFPRLRGRHLAEFYRRHFDVQINAIQQRPGNAAKMILDFSR